jgi:serine/threonine-protein kinase
MTEDLLPRLRSALGEEYIVERELGRGGMATVYLARDLRHDRPVALKVLHPELAAVIGAERFLNEIRVTANLQHPHILPLFDSGHSDQLLYYVMPFVAGESLRARLARETQLPVDDAVRIAREVASALDYAHRQGVIHRDIKPENVLLQDGTALVADFGIALAVTKAGANRLTQTGLSLGTPFYMSPEQATGDREIDGRSDVYALASTLYEMLVGEPPFTGPTSQAVIAKLLTDQAPAVSAARPATPTHVAGAIHRGLQKLPADRFGSAAQFAAALDGGGTGFRTEVSAAVPARRVHGARTWQAVAAIFLLTAAGVAWYARSRPIESTGFQIARQLTFDGTVEGAAISPDGHWLAYIANDCLLRRTAACTSSLRVQEVDGSQSVQLVAWRELRPDLRWSPDGATLVFVGSPDGTSPATYVVNRLGGTPRRLAPRASAMDFTPDARAVLVALGTPGRQALASVDVGTLALHDSVPLRPGLTLYDIAPDLTGRRLAFTGTAATPGGGLQALVGMLDPRGRLLDSLVITVRNPIRWDSAGSSLLFYALGPGIADNLVALPVRGDHLEAARLRTVLGQTPTGYEGRFDAARTGRLAVVVSPLTHSIQVTRLGPRAPGWRTVTSRTGFVAWPAVSPDGATIAAASTDNLGDNIYLYPAAGGPPRAATTFPGARQDARWSPDGRRIAYQRYASDMRTAGVAVIDIGGGSERMVRTSIWSPGVVDWIADDKLVVMQNDSVLVVGIDGRMVSRMAIPDTLGGVAPPIEADPQRGLVAYMSSRLRRLVVLDVQRQSFRPLSQDMARGLPLAWEPDGALLIGEETMAIGTWRAAGVTAIRRISADGSSISTVMTVDRECGSIAIGGDGVVACSTAQSRPDVWLADRAGRSGW